MVVPKVIATPSKSYVAINSYKSDRSFPTSLCDLGRVSNIAAAVTLPRTSNSVNRNNVDQSMRNLPYKKRPISEVLDSRDSNYIHKNIPTKICETPAIVPHKKRRYTLESQSSTSSLDSQSSTLSLESRSSTSSLEIQSSALSLESQSSTPALATQYTIKTNPHRNSVSNPQVKTVKFNSTEASASHPQSNTSDRNTHLPFPHSTIQTLFLQPVQRRLQLTTTSSRVHRNQHHRLHGSNTIQKPKQQNVKIFSSEMGKLPTHHSLPKKLQQQNQLMSSQPTLQLPTSITEQLSTHHSNSKKLQQQNQQLHSENVQLQKQLSLFRKLIKNPHRLNQVITRIEQTVQ